jgi:UMF1 family MFS transporter
VSFSATCVLATVGLAFVEPGHAGLAIAVFVVANIAFEMGAAFYDSFLPDLVPHEKIGRVSGLGWGLGYVGGIVALVVALFGFVLGDAPLASALGFGTEAGANVRAISSSGSR